MGFLFEECMNACMDAFLCEKLLVILLFILAMLEHFICKHFK